MDKFYQPLMVKRNWLKVAVGATAILLLCWATFSGGVVLGPQGILADLRIIFDWVSFSLVLGLALLLLGHFRLLGSSYFFLAVSALIGVGALDLLHAVVDAGAFGIDQHTRCLSQSRILSSILAAGALWTGLLLLHTPQTANKRVRWLRGIAPRMFFLSTLAALWLAVQCFLSARSSGATNLLSLLVRNEVALFFWGAMPLYFLVFRKRVRQSRVLKILALTMIPYLASEIILLMDNPLIGNFWARDWSQFLRTTSYLIPFGYFLRNYYNICRADFENIELRVRSLAMDTVKNGILITDPKLPDNPIVYCNRAFVELTGYSREEIMGRNPRFLHGADKDQEELKRLAKAVREHRECEVLVRNYRKSGEVFWCQIAVAPVFDNDGRLVNYVSSQADVTAKVEVELAEIARLKAEATSNAKGLFLATMSHEIRNPLTAIVGFAELLELKEIDPTRHEEFLRRIRENATHLKSLVDNILDYSRLELKGGKAPKSEFQVQRELDFVIGTLNEVYHSRMNLVKVTVEVASKVPEVFLTDAGLVRQILLNLVGNALKFTEKGWVNIRVYTGKENGNSPLVYFEISDSGCGIPREDREKVFEVFHRSNPNQAKYPGTGLGLPFCRKAAQSLSGDIQLTASVEGMGSTFLFYVPMDLVAEGVKPMPLETPAIIPGVSVGLAGKRILIVDDSEDIHLLLETILTRVGAVVDLVSSGEGAIHQVREHAYDLIFMDLQMPSMGGKEATAVLRSQGVSSPIIALTASVSPEEKQQCLAGGFSDYFTKPINPSEFVKQAMTWVAH